MKTIFLAFSLLISCAFSAFSQEEVKISKNLKISGNWCEGFYMLEADFNKKGGTWQWAKDGVVIEDAIENRINLALLGNGKYTVMYKTANNKVIYSDEYEFKTLPGVKANFEYTPFIAASAIHFKNTSMNADAGCTYLWNFGNGITSTELNPIALFNEGTYTVTLTVTDKNGCINTTEQHVTFAFPH